MFMGCYLVSRSNAAIGPTANSAYYTTGSSSQNITPNQFIINSATGNSTNAVLSNGVGNFCYPMLLSNVTSSVTQFVCMVPINIQFIHHLSLQFTVQPAAGSQGAIGATNCVWEIVKSVSGGPVLNVNGTNGTNFLPFLTPGNTFYDVLGYVTNVFTSPSNTSTAVASYSDIPRTVATYDQSTDSGIAGVNMLYIYGVSIGATNGITNYVVVGNGD